MVRLLILLLLVPRVVDAKMMQHFDLAGLVLRSDAIVIADRVGPTPNHLTRYHVVRTLRGTVMGDVDVDDQLYSTTGHKIDAHAVLFLAHRDGAAFLVSSGLRVTEGGKVFRFEQWDNPGGFTMVPQGKDPQDQWQGGTAQLDFAGLERAIGDAIRRVDALAAARTERDPAKRRLAVLALLPPRGAAESTGFYSDAFAHEAEAVVASDLEGALLIEQRDHGSPWQRGDYAGIPDLVAYAQAAKPTELRVIAIGAIARHPDLIDHADAVRAMIALLADSEPTIRAAAIAAAAHTGAWSTGDAEPRLVKLAGEARTAIGKRYAVETDPDVLFAIADAFERDFQRPLPAKRNAPPIVARARVDHAYIDVDVICTHPKVRATNASVTATRDGVAVPVHAFNVAPRCGEGSSGTGTSSDAPLAAGSYKLTVAIDLDRKHAQVALGTLVVGADGEVALTP